MRTQTATVTGVSTSPWLPLDPYSEGTNDGIFVNPGAGATVSVEVTADNIFDSTVTPVAFSPGAAFAGLTTKAALQLPFAARAVRLNQTVGATTSTLQTVVRGIQ